MNPFFEQRWHDAYTMLISYIRDALQPQLPSDLIAGAEEEIVAVASEGLAGYRADVAIKEPWDSTDGDSLVLHDSPATAAIAEPQIFFLEDAIERHVEIRDRNGTVITVLELLSPSNKVTVGGRERYVGKRTRFWDAGVNVVEIDLIREGQPIFPELVCGEIARTKAPYGVCVYRVSGEVAYYAIGLRDRLPAIRVPLRKTDAPVVLDLQPLIDQCHERGRYHLLRYDLPLFPPLTDSGQTRVHQTLREHGLIS